MNLRSEPDWLKPHSSAGRTWPARVWEMLVFLGSSPGVLAQKGTEHSLGGHGSPGSRPVADRYESSAALSLALCVSQGSSSTTRPAHHTSSRLLTRAQVGADKEPCLYPGARCWVSQSHLSQTPLNAAQTTTSSLQERPDTLPMFYLSAVMALRRGGRGSRTRPVLHRHGSDTLAVPR